MIKRLIFFVFAFFSFCCIAQATQNVQYYSSTQDQIGVLPVTNGSTYNYYTAYMVQIPNLVPADIVQCMGQSEETNPYSYNVMIGRAIARGTSWGGTGAGFTWLNPPTSENVSPNMHHMAIQNIGFDTGQTGYVYYSLILYAASGSGTSSLTHEAGYGGIYCLVYKSS